MSLALPEVSLISSWYVPLPGENVEGTKVTSALPALEFALRNRIAVHDLYFLSHPDIKWYAMQGKARDCNNPLDFAASLTPKQMDDIAKALIGFLTEHYSGALIGPCPRFAALASYWPLISLPPQEDPDDLRDKSICAVRNSLYLAGKLGCRHVEIVGGSAVPEDLRARKQHKDPKAYRDCRLELLADALCKVYDQPLKDKTQLGEVFGENVPYACVEIEPGTSFLMNNLQAFLNLHDKLDKMNSAAKPYTLFNADIAHLILVQGESNTEIEKVQGNVHLLGHMHLSDHARSHASDLGPGVYHFFRDYRPWLEIAIDQASRSSRFSRTVAMELEAISDIHEAARAIGKVSRWLEELRREKERTEGQQNVGADPQVVEGAILVVDIGNSTATHFSDPLAAVASTSQLLEELLEEVAKAAHENGGSVLSFTGDGIIGFFDETRFLEQKRGAADAAVDSAVKITDEVLKWIDEKPGPKAKSKMTVRVSLHYGKIHLPSAGRLRNQAVGRNVVIGTRLCDWISEVIEPSVPEEARDAILAASKEFIDGLGVQQKQRFVRWGETEFKGIGKVEVWVEQQYLLPKEPKPTPAP